LIWKGVGNVPELSLNGKRFLKGIHIFFVCTWIGAGVSMLFLGFANNQTVNGDEFTRSIIP